MYRGARREIDVVGRDWGAHDESRGGEEEDNGDESLEGIHGSLLVDVDGVD